ncbi:MAG: hypothetical protein H0T85_00590, partial [Geodermatophilaceae bacterium]|nr:hypothetical protein [Geodermatophilaceae bacterium]
MGAQGRQQRDRAAWDGHGAVRLHRYDDDRQALLLERLDGDRCLTDQPDADAACEVIGGLLAGLHEAAVSAPGVRSIADEAQRLLASFDEWGVPGS